MGVMAPTVDDPHCSSNKPKERQFQVVPVPGVFCRGRWKCCDFREADNAEPGIIEFPKHGEIVNHDTIVVTSVGANTGKVQEPITITSTINVPIIHEKAGLVANDEGFVSSASTNVLQTSPEKTSQPIFAVSESDLSRQASAATVNIPVTQTDKPTEPGDSQPQVGIHAIDSKIEQAMDLVKSHLTFAVREEVEDLRKTITKLEAKVSLLESQNALLKKYAPPEIVNNLATLIQNQQIPPIHSKQQKAESELPGSRTLSPLPNEQNMQ